MKTIILTILIGSLYNHVRSQGPQEQNWSGRNLTSIPNSNSTSIRKLNLSQNEISLTADDQNSLAGYPNLTELDLGQNSITKLINQYFTALSTLEVLILRDNKITSVGEMSLDGLKYLKILDLSFNHITQIPTNIQIPSVYLQVFDLQNNSLRDMDIKEALKDLKGPLKLTLSGNPWNCTCSLFNLSLWLNTDMVDLENENITLCATPNNMVNYNITAVKAQGNLLNCSDSNMSPSIAPIPSFDNSSSPVTTLANGTNSTSTKGNSWTFLVGVIIVGLVTSLLILLAVKFPRWYDFILSYNHHRLKEEDPDMFEEEFNVDFNMGNNDRNLDDENVVVFEQTHSFVPEEDGFIEDKYIDERDITES